MRITLSLLFVLFSLAMNVKAQTKDSVPYKEIPEYPADYTSGNVFSRMIDGLGYRFYWASEGLEVSEMDYRPSEDARSLRETLQHLHDLSVMILNSVTNTPNTDSGITDFSDHEAMRVATLNNLKKASDLFLNLSAKEIEQLKLTFLRGEKKTEVPLWHLINGPIADALSHTGQIVSFRRSVGNPINPKVNVFMGKTGN